MRKILFSLLLIAFVSVAQAEVITLKSGAVVRGTIVLQNDEVVIIKSNTGARFQYPREEVESIVVEETPVVQETMAQEDNSNQVQSVKKVAVTVDIMGGGAWVPTETTGGYFGAELGIGTHNLLNKRIFLGGGVGYHAIWKGEKKPCSFLPIMLMVKAPLMTGKHAPMVGVSLGYGVALKNATAGGLYADIQAGYTYQINSKRALFVGADLQFQQATIKTDYVIGDSSTFSENTGRAFLSLGLRFGVFF